MRGNAYFPIPSPNLSVISSDANNLEAAFLAAQTRAKGTSAQMHAMVKVLDLSLRALANYVENIANAYPDNALTIIESAGMDAKKIPVHKPHELAVVASGKGEVTLTCPVTKRASYKWEVTTADPAVETNWKLLAEVRKSRLIQTGLASATVHHFRQWTFGPKGLEPVSQVLSTTVL